MKLNEITSQLHKIKSLPNFPHKKTLKLKQLVFMLKKTDTWATMVGLILNKISTLSHFHFTGWLLFQPGSGSDNPDVYASRYHQWASAPRLRFYRARSSKCVERARGQISSLLVARRETGARVVPTLVDRGGSDVVVSWWPLSGNMQKPSRQPAANDNTP